MLRRRSIDTINKVDSHTLLLLHFDGNVTDSSPYNRTMTIASSVAYKTGHFGNGIYFNKNANYIYTDRTFFVNLLNSGTYTIDFWIKTDSSGTDRIIFGLDNGTANVTYCYQDGDNRLMFGMWGWEQTSNRLVYVNNLSSGFNHVAIVCKNGYATMYINGVAKQSGSFTPVIPASVPFTIGGRTTGNSNYNKIILDEFRISDVARWSSDFSAPKKQY